MDTRDIGAVGGALIVVLVLALVVKPMLLGSESSITPLTEGYDPLVPPTPAMISPVPPQTSIEEVPYTPAWNGTVIILSFSGSRDPEGSLTNSSMMNATGPVNASPTPTPRIFLGQSTVKGTEGIIPADKPGIPEGAVKIPFMNNSQKNGSTLIFDKTYTLSYTTVGLLVDVVKPPFTLQFTTTPTTVDPLYKNNPHYCFFTVTIRDPVTKDVVSEGGYGGVYGTDHEKSIIIYRSGEYHITLYGNMVQVKISIFARA